MTNKFKSLFSYYGGKGRIAHKYPAPMCDTIVEPFAGAAGYALQYFDHNVILIDSRDRTAHIWQFLLSDDAEYWVDFIPDEVVAGQIVDDLIPDAPVGLVEIMRSECNQGTQGQSATRRQVTKLGAACWPLVKRKLLYFIPRIRHWTFIHGSYTDAPNICATWFIDPPYSTKAGQLYEKADIDYNGLGNWCLAREGQVIVCENAGATWLPFDPLIVRQGIKSRYQKSNAMEVMYHDIQFGVA